VSGQRTEVSGVDNDGVEAPANAEGSPAAKLSIVADGERDGISSGDANGLEVLLGESLHEHRDGLEGLGVDARNRGDATESGVVVDAVKELGVSSHRLKERERKTHPHDQT
jgi:hypothetical protein